MLDLLFSKVGAVFTLLALAFGIFLGWSYEYGTEQTVTFTVENLQATQGSSSTINYMVFTTDGTEYQDGDSWLHGKTDSSNVWNDFLRAGDGATWKCPVYGWRNTVTSSYKDILDGCKLVSPAPAKS